MVFAEQDVQFLHIYFGFTIFMGPDVFLESAEKYVLVSAYPCDSLICKAYNVET